jgi:hypothetical protein
LLNLNKLLRFNNNFPENNFAKLFGYFKVFREIVWIFREIVWEFGEIVWEFGEIVWEFREIVWICPEIFPNTF